MPTAIGSLETQFFAYVQMRGLQTICGGELSRALGLKPAQEREVLSRLQAIYGSRIRSLVDAVYDWSRFGSLPRAYQWIRTELANDRKAASRLVKTALEYGNVSTIRRLGKLLEREAVMPSLLRQLEQALPPSSASIAWVPTKPKRGSVDRRWGVVFNE